MRATFHQCRHQQLTLLTNSRACRGQHIPTLSVILDFEVAEQVGEQFVCGRFDNSEQVVVQSVFVRLAQLASIVLREKERKNTKHRQVSKSHARAREVKQEDKQQY